MKDTDYAARHAGQPVREIIRTVYFNGRRWIAGVAVGPDTVTYASGLFYSGGIYSRSTRKR
jgi:hypothetical protein